MNFSEAFVVELFVLLVFDLTLFWRLVCLFDIPRRVFACIYNIYVGLLEWFACLIFRGVYLRVFACICVYLQHICWLVGVVCLFDIPRRVFACIYNIYVGLLEWFACLIFRGVYLRVFACICVYLQHICWLVGVVCLFDIPRSSRLVPIGLGAPTMWEETSIMESPIPLWKIRNIQMSQYKCKIQLSKYKNEKYK